MADTRSRLYQTNLRGWHQLIALDEGYINQSFQFMYDDALDSDEPSPLVVFNKTIKHIAKMTDCTLLAPKIMLVVDDIGLNTLQYYLRLKSGKLLITYEDKDGEDQQKEFNVSGWIYAFRIGIGQKEVEKGSAEFKAITERVAIPGEFSLHKLWLDSTKANTENKALQHESYYGGLDWSTEPDDIQRNFRIFISEWITAADKAGQTLLGVSVLPKTTDVDATFPPTYLTKQTYPWQNPAVTPPPAPKNGQPENMLLYLMMANNVTPPTPAQLPPGNGMWNDPTSAVKGTYAMSNKLFWDQWLIPRLQSLSRDTSFYFGDPIAEVEGTKMRYGLSWAFGELPITYDFTPGLPNGKTGYGWGFKYEREREAHDKNAVWNVRANQTGSNINYVKCTPGSPLIEIGGTGKSRGLLDFAGPLSGSPQPTWASVDVELTWSITLEITSVVDGGLEINVLPPKDGTYHKCGFTTDSHKPPQNSGDFVQRYGEQAKKSIDDTFSKRMPLIAASLADKFKDQDRLFLPGSRSFFFKNGTFNSNGDLLVQVRYDGTTLTRVAALEKETLRVKQASNIPELESVPRMKPLMMAFEVEENERGEQIVSCVRGLDDV